MCSWSHNGASLSLVSGSSDFFPILLTTILLPIFLHGLQVGKWWPAMLADVLHDFLRKE